MESVAARNRGGAFCVCRYGCGRGQCMLSTVFFSNLSEFVFERIQCVVNETCVCVAEFTQIRINAKKFEVFLSEVLILQNSCFFGATGIDKGCKGVYKNK